MPCPTTALLSVLIERHESGRKDFFFPYAILQDPWL